ncbi:MAG: TRAP transporter small permease subunit [Caldilineales bacterium]|nr:TRAP transporter small permease subunit [Caldilineales bacterium]
MKRVLVGYTRAIDSFSEFLGRLSMYLVIITVSVGFTNVVLRYVGRFVGLRLTSNLFIELQWYLYSLIFFFGFAYILKHNINVRVDFWYGRQSLRTKAWIDLIGHFIALIPFCLIGIWVTLNPVLLSWGRRPNGTWGSWELSPDPNGLPRAPIKTMILVAFITLLLQAIVEVIRQIAVLRDVDELKSQRVLELEAPLRIE